MQVTRLVVAVAVSVIAIASTSSRGVGQQVTGVPGSPEATTTIDGKQLPPPDPPFGGVMCRKRIVRRVIPYYSALTLKAGPHSSG